MTQRIRLKWSSPRTRDTHTCCQGLGSGAITTCFNDVGLSRPGIEPPISRMRGEPNAAIMHEFSQPSRHLRNYYPVSLHNPRYVVLILICVVKVPVEKNRQEGWGCKLFWFTLYSLYTKSQKMDATGKA